MDSEVKQIFKDAGATDEDLKVIEACAVRIGLEMRDLIDCAAIGCPRDLWPAVRVYIVRVIHTDMETEFNKYRTRAHDSLHQAVARLQEQVDLSGPHTRIAAVGVRDLQTVLAALNTGLKT